MSGVGRVRGLEAAVLVGALGFAVLGCSSSASGEAHDDGDASSDDACACCSNESDGAGKALAAEVKTLIDQTCTNTLTCHGSGAGGMTLTVGNEFTNMINVASTEKPSLMRVAPGDPENSYAYLKLHCESGYVQSCMPLNSSPDPSAASLFYAWIGAGAPTP
jgi:hypothetical protein